MLEVDKVYKRVKDGQLFRVISIDAALALDIRNDKAVSVGFGSDGTSQHTTYTIEGKYIYYDGEQGKRDNDLIEFKPETSAKGSELYINLDDEPKVINAVVDPINTDLPIDFDHTSAVGPDGFTVEELSGYSPIDNNQKGVGCACHDKAINTSGLITIMDILHNCTFKDRKGIIAYINAYFDTGAF